MVSPVSGGCITNDSKTSALEATHVYRLTVSVGPGAAGRGPPEQGLTKLPSRSGCGLLRGWPGDGSAPTSVQVWADGSTLCTLGLRASVSCWLSAGDYSAVRGPSEVSSQHGHLLRQSP